MSSVLYVCPCTATVGDAPKECPECGALSCLLDGEEDGSQADSAATTEGRTARSDYAPCIQSARYDSKQTHHAREWVMTNLLALGTMNVWIGPEKSRKSCFALLRAMHIACGKDHDNFTVLKPRTVVFFSAEDPSEELDIRYKAMLAQFSATEQSLIQQNLAVIKGRELFVNKGINIEARNREFWEEFARQYPAEVYFLDALEMFHSGNNNDQMRDTLLKLRSRLGAKNCLVILHHTRKKEDKEIGAKEPVWLRRVGVRAWSDKALGAGALKRLADVIMCQEFRQVRDKDGEVLEESTDFASYGKIIEDIPLLTYEDDTTPFSYRLIRKLSAAVNASLDTLRKAGGPWSSKNAAATATGLSRSQGNVHVRELLCKGYLREKQSGEIQIVP